MPVLLSGGQPMLALSEEGGRRAAVLGFDLHDSNLPLKADFPVLVQNLLSWLLPDAAASVEAAGCGMPVSFVLDARSVSAWVETPDGGSPPWRGTAFPIRMRPACTASWKPLRMGRCGRWRLLCTSRRRKAIP